MQSDSLVDEGDPVDGGVDGNAPEVDAVVDRDADAATISDSGCRRPYRRGSSLTGTTTRFHRMHRMHRTPIPVKSLAASAGHATMIPIVCTGRASSPMMVASVRRSVRILRARKDLTAFLQSVRVARRYWCACPDSSISAGPA